MRSFESGATRDSDESKHDYDGFLSYPALVAYGAYMHMHRLQEDGKLRDSDNWQRRNQRRNLANNRVFFYNTSI